MQSQTENMKQQIQQQPVSNATNTYYTQPIYQPPKNKGLAHSVNRFRWTDVIRNFLGRFTL